MTRSSLGARSKACLATACGTLASPDVKETLRASHEALRALPGIQRVATSTPPSKNQQETAFSYGLESYGRLTQTYFVKRRCSYLNRRQVELFYGAIIRSHHATMLQFGKPESFRSAEICRNPCRCAKLRWTCEDTGDSQFHGTWQPVTRNTPGFHRCWALESSTLIDPLS